MPGTKVKTGSNKGGAGRVALVAAEMEPSCGAAPKGQEATPTRAYVPLSKIAEGTAPSRRNQRAARLGPSIARARGASHALIHGEGELFRDAPVAASGQLGIPVTAAKERETVHSGFGESGRPGRISSDRVLGPPGALIKARGVSGEVAARSPSA